MNNKYILLFLKLGLGFFLNVSAGYFFAMYADISLLVKRNARIACVACFAAIFNDNILKLDVSILKKLSG